MRSVYLDYNATTPLDPQVLEVMKPFLTDTFGNPSSIHHIGRKARSLLDDARDRVARVWACKPSEVVFTSGGTESNNLAVLGVARKMKPYGRHVITSSVEHDAVLHAFDYLRKYDSFDVTVIQVDSAGVVSPSDIAKSIRPDTVLVSVMAANNETGTVQPVAEIGRICREKGVLFHTDAVQWFGKIPFQNIHLFNADLVSCCAHKFHGPKGAGALFIKSPLLPDPILFGGAHENERRAGTENLASVVGLAEAMEKFVPNPVFASNSVISLRDQLSASVESLSGVAFRGSKSSRLPNTVAFTVPGADSIALLAALDLEGICASSGSACSAGSLEPSHVMLAMGVPAAEANSLVRFSLGRENTAEELDYTIAKLPAIIQRVRGK